LRLDLFLKQARLVKRRTLARELCREGAVSVNGARARPAKEVAPGDRLSVRLWNTLMEIEVAELPVRPPSAVEARKLYRILSERKTAVDEEGRE
jgi:ribosomal 50S subunit-recycling heat shock protein